jgi:hypothetical protein
VSPNKKQAMQAALRVASSGDRNIRLNYFDGLSTKSLIDLIDSTSMQFFKILRFNLNFFCILILVNVSDNAEGGAIHQGCE